MHVVVRVRGWDTSSPSHVCGSPARCSSREACAEGDACDAIGYGELGVRDGDRELGGSQATGAPNETGCTASGRSWAPANYSSTAPEWLRLEYATPVKAVGVSIRENRDAGSVTKVELIDEADGVHEVWAGTDGTQCGGTLEVKFEETPYRVKAVKLTTGGKAWEEIDAVALVSAPLAAATVTTAFEYDANGLRTYKSDTAGETRYLLDGLSVVAQYATTGERQAWYTQSLARIDEVLSVVNAQGKYWYQADALGSIYALTTAAGDVRARGGYDVFGEPVAMGGTSVGQPFGFTGREHELDAALVYARARYMSPATGRWISEDPVNLRSMMVPSQTDVLLAGTPYALLAQLLTDPHLANRYANSRSAPTMFTDPLGQIPILTVLHGLGYAATIMGVVSFFSVVGVAAIAASMYMAGEYGVAHDLAQLMVALAISTVGFLVVGAILAPELMAVLAYQEYWWVGVTLLFLGCVGYAAGKIQGSGGARGWSTLGFCAMRFWKAWVTRDPTEFFKRPGEC